MAEAAVATRQPYDAFTQIVSSEFAPPLIIDISEQAWDVEPRLQAARLIGSVATEHVVGYQQTEPTPEYTTLEAIRDAAAGSQPARQMLKTNFRTDMVERAIKSGHITSVQLGRDEQGRILQHGQTNEQIQINNLRYGSQSWQMRERSKIEVLNKFRIDYADKNGWLEDYYLIVASRPADNMSDEQANDEGFFTDTASVALQATTIKNGQLTIESAFVAGKRDRFSERHDAVTVDKLGRRIGVDWSGSSAQTLDKPVLIHKSLLPNGLIDLVPLYDECAGGTFFGEDKPQQNYLAYAQQCAQREAALAHRVERATQQLINEVGNISTPQEAPVRMAKLSAAEMIGQAVVDESIDTRVFGVDAAFRIEHARYLMEQGEYDQASVAMSAALRVETSRSCPGGSGGTPDQTGQTGLGEGKSGASEQLKDCDFTSKKCPVCGEKDAKTRVRNGKYYHIGKSCRG